MHISLDEKIATGSLFRTLRIFPWPKIARHCPGNFQILPGQYLAILASQGNMHKNSHTKVIYMYLICKISTHGTFELTYHAE